MIRSLVAVVAAAALLTVLAASSALASENGTLSLVKNCSEPTPTCLVTTSNLSILLGSTFHYLAIGNLGTTGSPMLITTGPDVQTGIASGICHFYDAIGTGHCEFTGGQGSLEGFHANLIVTWIVDTDNFSLVGPYWFDRQHNDFQFGS